MCISIPICYIGGFIGLLGLILYMGMGMNSEKYVENIIYFIKTILGVIVDIIIINLFLIVYFGLIFLFIKLMNCIKI